jgi:hypothetical protein
MKQTWQQFWEFHLKHPIVYTLFEKFAFELINKGRTKLGSKMIIERIRWEMYTGSKDGKGFKINNNFTCYYSRLFAEKNPTFENYFVYKQIKK